MPIEDVLKMLSAQSANVGAQQNKLQQLAAQPIDRSFLENGQNAMDMLRNPNQEQSSALLQAGLSMLGSDPRDPSRGMSEGISAGLNLHGAMKDQSRQQQLGAQGMAVKGAQGGFDRSMDLTDIGLDLQGSMQDTSPTLTDVPVQFLDPAGNPTQTGRVNHNSLTGEFTDIKGNPLDQSQFQEISVGKTDSDLASAGNNRPPAGYRWLENGNLEAIPGGPKDILSVEAGGKAAMTKTALQNLPMIDELLYEKNEDGTPNREKLNRKNVATSRLPIPGIEIAVPFTEGASLDVLYKDTIEAKIRLESGAAVPDGEVVRANDRFRPSAWDSLDTVNVKRDMLERYFNNAESYYDPTGAIGADGKPTAKLTPAGEAFFNEVDAAVQVSQASGGAQPPTGITPEVWDMYTPDQQQVLRTRLAK